MSARVTIHLLNLFRLELKKQYLQYEGRTVGDVIMKFESEYLASLPDYLKSKDKKHLNDNILILVNGANIKNMDDFKTSVKDSDEIQLSVPIIGG